MANSWPFAHLSMKRNLVKSSKSTSCSKVATFADQLRTKRCIFPSAKNSEAHPQLLVKSSHVQNSNMVFVGKLPKNIQHELVYGYFQQFGTITKFIMPKQATPSSEVSKTYKGFAYITYASPESANAALNYQHVLEGKHVASSAICPKMPQPIRS